MSRRVMVENGRTRFPRAERAPGLTHAQCKRLDDLRNRLAAYHSRRSEFIVGLDALLEAHAHLVRAECCPGNLPELVLGEAESLYRARRADFVGEFEPMSPEQEEASHV